jgi:hypothetical protein
MLQSCQPVYLVITAPLENGLMAGYSLTFDPT